MFQEEWKRDSESGRPSIGPLRRHAGSPGSAVEGILVGLGIVVRIALVGIGTGLRGLCSVEVVARVSRCLWSIDDVVDVGRDRWCSRG